MTEKSSEAKVCILLPVQNNEGTIESTLSSLLNQSFTDFKILVVDDGSLDNTARVLKKFDDKRLHILRFKKSIGLVHSINLAISEIDEEYIVMAHENTRSDKQRLQTLVSFMEANPEIGICGSRVKYFDDREQEKIPLTDNEIRASMLFCKAIAHETVIMRTSLLEVKGFRYRDKYPNLADYDLWFRVMGSTKFANIDEPLVEILPEQPNTFKFIYSRSEATSFFVEKFTKMGIQPAEKELLVHLDLCKLEKVKRFSSPQRYKNWMNKLIQYNKDKKLFPEAELQKLLDEKWKKLYPYMLGQNSQKISDYMKIEGHSRIDIFKFLFSKRLKELFS